MTSTGRLNLGLGTALVALAAGAWYLVVLQSAGMSMAMEISIPVYLATWVTMLAAMMLPATLSILSSTFQGRERGVAFAVWGSVAGGAGAALPVAVTPPKPMSTPPSM